MPYLNYMFLQLQIAVAKLIACRCYAKAELCCSELEKEGNIFLWVVVIKQLIPFGSYSFVKSTKIIDRLNWEIQNCIPVLTQLMRRTQNGRETSFLDNLELTFFFFLTLGCWVD